MTRRACLSRVVRSSGKIRHELALTFWWPDGCSTEDFSKSLNSFATGIFFSDCTFDEISRNVFNISGAILRPENNLLKVGHGMSTCEFFAKTSAADVLSRFWRPCRELMHSDECIRFFNDL